HSYLSVQFLFLPLHDPTSPQIYTLSLHDALPIYGSGFGGLRPIAITRSVPAWSSRYFDVWIPNEPPPPSTAYRFAMIALLLLPRSEEHTSELQSRSDLVCRLLLEKKKNKNKYSET